MTQPVAEDFTFDTEDGISDGAVALRYSEKQKRLAAASAESNGQRLATANGASPGECSGLPLYLDFETVPDESRQHLFGLDELPKLRPETSIDKLPIPSELIGGTVEMVKAVINGNVCPDGWLASLATYESDQKKPRAGVLDAIAAARAARKSEPDRILDAYKAQRKQMSTTPEMCRIVAMGWAVGSDAPQSLVVGVGVDEKAILATAWVLIRKHSPIVGFNLLNFDLPVLMCRSILLGITSSRMVNLGPWNNRDVIDLQVARNGRAIPEKGKGLKWLAAMYGVKVPAGDFDGSKVEETMRSPGGPEVVGQYVRSDVTITRELHQLFSGYFCV